ncbi:MAG: hypothetical protein QX193_02470 [Methylococcales bacterium]|nr:hypothetical protein [Methylococcales bacterium]
MKRLFLVFVMIFFVTGCVYTARHPFYGYSGSDYGYSRYTTVSPAYPRYQQQEYYYTPAPYFRSHERREYDYGRSRTRSHHHW